MRKPPRFKQLRHERVKNITLGTDTWRLLCQLLCKYFFFKVVDPFDPEELLWDIRQ